MTHCRNNSDANCCNLADVGSSTVLILMNNYLIADVVVVVEIVVAGEIAAVVVEDRTSGHLNWLAPNERRKLRLLPSPTPD